MGSIRNAAGLGFALALLGSQALAAGYVVPNGLPTLVVPAQDCKLGTARFYKDAVLRRISGDEGKLRLKPMYRPLARIIVDRCEAYLKAKAAESCRTEDSPTDEQASASARSRARGVASASASGGSPVGTPESGERKPHGSDMSGTRGANSVDPSCALAPASYTDEEKAAEAKLAKAWAQSCKAMDKAGITTFSRECQASGVRNFVNQTRTWILLWLIKTNQMVNDGRKHRARMAKDAFQQYLVGLGTKPTEVEGALADIDEFMSSRGAELEGEDDDVFADDESEAAGSSREPASGGQGAPQAPGAGAKPQAGSAR